MDSIYLSESSKVLEGLKLALHDFDDAEEVVQTYVDVANALFIVEIAKFIPDEYGYFPGGKWATIQNIQGKIDKEMLTQRRRMK